MTSAFKNFFITFIICLLMFGLLGFNYVYPFLDDLVSGIGDTDTSEGDENDVSEESSEISGDESSEHTEPIILDNYDENGEVFTAVIFCADSAGRALKIVFIDANGKTGQYIYCPISPDIKMTNKAGVSVPLRELFATLTPEAVAQCVSAMTGIETKYCLRFTAESLASVASVIPGASVVLNEPLLFANPYYVPPVSEEEGTENGPEQISIFNTDGKVLLNEKYSDKTYLEWLLIYNDMADNNAVYTDICTSLMTQALSLSSIGYGEMSGIINACDTNISADTAISYIPTIFSYNKFERHKYIYPSNWVNAVKELRELDGEYKYH